MDEVAPLDHDVVLSPRWLSAALSRAGATADVRQVEVLWSVKTTATKTRFAVACGPEMSRAQYCVKGFFEAPLPASAASYSQAEANFYLHVRQRVSLRAPTAPYVAIHPASGHGIVLMDDLIAARARFLTALEPYSVDQAAASLDQLARLHAPYWGKDLASQFPWLVGRLDNIARQSMIPLDMLQDLLDGERGEPLPAEVKDARRIHRGLQAIAAHNTGQPQCLVHGDAHAGNVFELDGQPGLIDWQLLQGGTWALDVAYHLAAALSEEDRERSEQHLLRHYLDRLRAHGIEPPGWDAAWRDYRTHVLYGYYLWGITRRVDPPIIREFVKRLGRAVAALDSFALLGV